MSIEKEEGKVQAERRNAFLRRLATSTGRCDPKPAETGELLALVTGEC
jgi:hypothetical protein